MNATDALIHALNKDGQHSMAEHVEGMRADIRLYMSLAIIASVLGVAASVLLLVLVVL